MKYEIPQTYQEIDCALDELKYVASEAEAIQFERDTAFEIIQLFRIPAASVVKSRDGWLVKSPAGFLSFVETSIHRGWMRKVVQ